MKPDYHRIETLEQELLTDPPRPAGEMRGYLLLIDSEGRDASDRLPVTFTVGMTSPGNLSFKLLGGPFTLIPTRIGMLRAAVKLGDGDEWMPACSPDVLQRLRPGDTFIVTP